MTPKESIPTGVGESKSRHQGLLTLLYICTAVFLVLFIIGMALLVG